jgi:ParB family chromosome partitioning protein
VQIELAAIQPNPFQPRRHFDPEALAELAQSIRAQGVLQPVLVRRQGSGFELIAGERRFRAAQLAGLERIPALVRAYNDERSLAVALIENLQRSDLNPIEQAQAFLELGQRFRLTQEQIATATGKERVTVANYLRLLRLEPEVIELVRAARLTPGQVRPLIGLARELQCALAERIAAEAWSARRVEQHVQRLNAPPAPATPAPPRDPNERDAELRLAQALGAKVALKPGRGKAGVIEIRYASLDDFQRLFDRLVGE